MSQSQANVVPLLTHPAPRPLRYGQGALTREQRVAPEIATREIEVLLQNLARSVFEVLAGVREVEQISRWLSPEVFSRLLARAQHSARARKRRGVAAIRPQIEPIRCTWQTPTDGVVEATVLVDLGSRVRAVAVRLEAYGGRWRAEGIHIL